MNQLEIKSINKHLTEFAKTLTNTQLIGLVEWFCYKSLETPFEAPNDIAKKFIDTFFGEFVFANILSDERGHNNYFLKSSLSERELYNFMRIGLLQESFFRLKDSVDKPVAKPKEDKLTLQDKKDLRDILKEHNAMLEYQLEDESDIIKTGGQELLDEKKRHKEFIKKFGKLKLF